MLTRAEFFRWIAGALAAAGLPAGLFAREVDEGAWTQAASTAPDLTAADLIALKEKLDAKHLRFMRCQVTYGSNRIITFRLQGSRDNETWKDLESVTLPAEQVPDSFTFDGERVRPFGVPVIGWRGP